MDLGNSLDLPFEAAPPGQSLDLSDARLSGGVVVMAAMVPVPEVGPKPGLVFRFTMPDGRFYPPVLLVVDDDQAAKLPDLVDDAVRAARRAARKGALMGLTTDPSDPRLTHGVDAEPVSQAEAYLVLSDEERANGFVRPVRRSYQHLPCGTVTTMHLAIAETYARDPSFYGATYCCGCRKHLPVGEHGEFVWVEADGSTGPKVGT